MEWQWTAKGKKSGGLALWWKDGIGVSVRPWCRCNFDTKINVDVLSWRFTGIYEESGIDLREKTWEVFRYLHG
jgi:hypothetical protein